MGWGIALLILVLGFGVTPLVLAMLCAGSPNDDRTGGRGQ